MAYQDYFSGLPTDLATTPVSDPLSSDVSTLETVNQMATLSRRNAGYPQVRAATDEALKGIDYSTASHREIASRIWQYCKKRVRFVQDEDVLQQEFGVSPANELLIEPSVLLSMDEPRGDCDDFSMLCASMLLAAGLPAHFVTIAADRQAPGRWSHVYCGTVLENGEEFTLDASHGPYAGWEKEDGVYRKAKWLVWQPKGLGMARNPEDAKVIDAGFPGMRGLGKGNPSFWNRSALGDTTWMDVINTAVAQGGNIAKTVLAPSTASGQYVIQNGQLYQVQPGQASILPTGSSSNTLLIALGLGAVLLVAMMGRR